MPQEPSRPKQEFAKDEARAFWQEARAKAARGEGNFDGVTFPPDPDGQGFGGVTFKGDASFCKAQFSGDVSFDEAQFAGDASFLDTCFGNHASFDEAQFSGDASFVGAQFSGPASFVAAQFKGNASFVGTQFDGHAMFLDAQFSDFASFWVTKFSGHASFGSAQFSCGAEFVFAQFSGHADFSSARFSDRVNFEHAMSSGVFVVGLPGGHDKGQLPFRLRSEGAGAYRLAKQSATNRGDYHLAGEYHYAEQCTLWWVYLKRAWKDVVGPRDKGETIPHRAWRGIRGTGRVILAMLGFLLGRLVFGYGERIPRIIGWALIVILGCTAYYAHYGIVESAIASASGQVVITHNPWDCLYFSIVTFTTVGYGDLLPAGNLRLMAGLEAIIGAFLMASFVVAMARRFTR
ncbi:MAG: potassium channel family protein [Phycisphaerae bacterium]|jgi:hypothetical protein